MADVLPGYSWSRSESRYRSNATGRFVARRDILGLLDAQVTTAESRLGELVTFLHEGRISSSAWQAQMRTELRRAHSQNNALGAGGWDRLSFAQWGREGQKLRGDYQRMTNLAQGIADGTVSLPQALERVRGYVGNARIQFWEADREAARQTGRQYEERRRLGGSAETCDDCVSYASQSWVPLDTLPVPGDGSICHTHCRCSMERREVTA